MANRNCRHIKVDGTHCGSPALTGTDFCYHHYRLRKRCRKLTAPRDAAPATPPAPALELGLILDMQSLQVALSRVINEIAAGRLKSRQAGRVLYCLQMAAANLRDG